jgi:hypothetical protein
MNKFPRNKFKSLKDQVMNSNKFSMSPGLTQQLRQTLCAQGWTTEDVHFLCKGAVAKRILAQLRTPAEQILRNLRQFGLDDQIFDASVPIIPDKSAACGHGDGKRYAEISEISVAEACGDQEKIFGGLPQFNERLTFCVLIKNRSVRIGYIDSDNRFQYESAPNTYSALGWLIATDLGREQRIEWFDVRMASVTLTGVIRTYGTTEATFRKTWFGVLREMMGTKKISRFADGYCGWATTLWQVATREVTGSAHPGYHFLY